MKALRFALYPALVSLAMFWLIAAQDFACSYYQGGSSCHGYIQAYITVAQFGLVGGASLGLGVLFFALYALRDEKIAHALYITGLLAFGQVWLFELGIKLTDPTEWNLHVMTLQIMPALAWTSFFTNSFLFLVGASGLMVILTCRLLTFKKPGAV